MLARVVTVVGHVAFQQLMHMDVRILGELKRRHRIQEREKEKKLEKTNIRRANQSHMSNMSNTSRMSTMSNKVGWRIQIGYPVLATGLFIACYARFIDRDVPSTIQD